LYGKVSNKMVKHLPIAVNGKTAGFVYGHDISKIAVITSLLNQLAEKRMMTDEILDRYNELKMLYAFVENFNTFNVKEIADFLIKYVAVKIEGKIESDNVSVMLINENTGELESISEKGWPVESLKDIAGNLVISGKADIINNCTHYPRFINAAGSITSIIYAPIKAKEKTLGIVTASTKNPHTYSAADLQFFRTLVSHAAVAIDNAILHKSLKEAFIQTVYALAATLETRDPYTGGHSKRVKAYSVAIAETLGISAADKERLEIAADLHDIGKVGVSDDVLHKPDKLTDEEFKQIKTHTTRGAEILSHIEKFIDVIPGVKYHHKRYDGGGYPDMPEGEELDLIAKIIAVADSFDAMTSDRSYRNALPRNIAFYRLREGSGTQFDQEVVNAFFVAVKKKKI
ncbi:MAG: HD domain-containing protein, partial [Nitrospirae bacterium]|nr:HD domain-containing protein [Nitrospirota bacterium]